MTKFVLFIVSVYLSTSMSLVKAEPIVFVLNDWASQRVHTKVVAQVLEEYGFEVEYAELGYAEQFGALRTGLAHVQIEAWEPDRSETFDRLVQAEQILIIGRHQVQAREEWWYPSYVEELCPGLPDWQAFNLCSSIFVKDVDSDGPAPIGTFFSAGWDNHEAEIIRSLGLNFKIERVSDSNELWSTLRLFSEHKIPIVLHNWTPNWTDKHIPGSFVQFPAFQPECETNPNWGLNKEMTHDCANRLGVWIQKIIWPKLVDEQPCIYQFLKQVSFTEEMLIDTPAMVFIDGLDEDQAAQMWRLKYANEINRWINASCLAQH
ncbi:glycine betaine ABC transporter substrate-binding protein [Alteromonas sp. ASW11-36]|uniref:Glycine betaine ABC transporter substrate-binding protein n=1 Tax=Alteromonas arenosi TaxID=3055817 RepID=A0ABT7T2Q1_9ALTE|nr:glycine betaine ABC transporter substrate-binding protein [Alteromonas sp. ASW11-36]MDM7862034.1 glycine betaine ABC transporter substrate-binding protein [Alteromonas sp. ASW11-36]